MMKGTWRNRWLSSLGWNSQVKFSSKQGPRGWICPNLRLPIPLGCSREQNVWCLAVLVVLCDESGHPKFPFPYLAHISDIAHPAQVRLRIGSGFSQACFTLLCMVRTLSGRLRRRIHSYFNSNRASPELVPYMKKKKKLALVPVFRKRMVPPSPSLLPLTCYRKGRRIPISGWSNVSYLGT